MVKKKNIEIAKGTKLTDLFKAYPEVKEIFLKYGMDCLHCTGIKQETIRHAAENHGIKLEEFVDEIKKVIEKKSGDR